MNIRSLASKKEEEERRLLLLIENMIPLFVDLFDL